MFKLFLLIIPIICISNLQAQDSTDIGYLILNIYNQKVGTDSFYVSINSDFENPQKIFHKDTLELPVGKILFTVFQKNYEDISFTHSIKANVTSERALLAKPFGNIEKQKTLSSYPRYYWQSSGFILTDDDTKVFYSGNELGSSIIALDSIKNTVNLKGIGFDGTSFIKSFEPTGNFNVFEFYYRPDKAKLRLYSIIPGVSQVYKKERLKAGIFFTAAVGTATSAFFFKQKYSSEYKKFEKIDEQYQIEIDPEKAFGLAQQAELQLNEANKKAKILNYFIAGFTANYLINIIDAFRKPKVGYRTNEIKFDPYLDFDRDIISVNFKLTKDF